MLQSARLLGAEADVQRDPQLAHLARPSSHGDEPRPSYRIPGRHERADPPLTHTEALDPVAATQPGSGSGDVAEGEASVSVDGVEGLQDSAGNGAGFGDDDLHGVKQCSAVFGAPLPGGANAAQM
jgi:hypothetical protein